MLLPLLNRIISQNVSQRLRAASNIYWLPCLAASSAVVTVLAIVYILNASEQKRFQQQNRTYVLSQLSATRAKLEGTLNQKLFVTQGLVAYISAINPNLNQKEFESLARVILAQQPTIKGIGLYKDNVITHIYPLKGSEKAIGFNPMKIPAERQAFQKAIDTRSTVVAGPVAAVDTGKPAFISRTPIFLTPPNAPPQSGAYWGMAAIGFDQNPLLQEVGLLNPSAQLQYAIRGKDALGAKGDVFFGDATIFTRSPVVLDVRLPYGSWQLAAIPAGGWPRYAPNTAWLWTGGGLLALLTGGLIFILVSAPTRLQQAVERATEALRNSEEALKQANADLQRLNELKDEFLANTSHELRTPLNGMIGIAESMINGATGALSQLQQKNLLLIVQSGHRLANLVNDILDFSKLRHKTMELQLNAVGMREIVEVVLTLSQPLTRNKELQLINAIPPDLPPAQADENRLQQILYNLVGNAIKFSDRGIVEISAALVSHPSSRATENEQLTIDKKQLAITVSDTGIGIPEDKLERIFEPFEQGDGSTARDYGGTGLGLAVTKQLVELQGGTIRVESEVAQGSRFTFTLPVAQEPPSILNCQSEFLKAGFLEQLRVSTLNVDSWEDKLLSGDASDRQALTLNNPRPSNVQPATSANQNFKILIVDDEPVNLQVLINHLALEDYAITQANNGLEALAIIEQGLKPDLVLLDVMMPRMTGYEVCRKLRETFLLNELPVVLLTAKNQVNDLVEGLAAGANDYLTKPISKNELLARIRTHLELANFNIAYRRFVPYEFLQLLNKESIIDVRLGDQVHQEMSILFSDIRDFTTLSETMTPEENFRFINSYLCRMEPAIVEYHGFIDKYIGDAIMALFSGCADDAVNAGIAMLQRLANYNQHRAKSGYTPIKIGIGINTGSLMLGTVGGTNRMDGTAISDAVNLASRLETLTKTYGVSMLISQQTLARLDDPTQYCIRFIEQVKVKGKSKAVAVFEVFDGDDLGIKEVKLATKSMFEEGLFLYYKGSNQAAVERFTEVLKLNPQDTVAQLYLDRCRSQAS
ncbi:MAG TPA: ATP-binding protein [Chroococcales cyanobacterium]